MLRGAQFELGALDTQTESYSPLCAADSETSSVLLRPLRRPQNSVPTFHCFDDDILSNLPPPRCFPHSLYSFKRSECHTIALSNGS
jgi:hypothetical protein